MHESGGGRRRRGLVLAGVVLAIGLPLTVTVWLSERNVDQEAGELAADLRRAGRQVDDVAALGGSQGVSDRDGSAGEPPLVTALGNGDALVGYALGATGLSVSYEVRWGLATRCVHLLLRDDSPVRTAVTDSATCQALAIE